MIKHTLEHGEFPAKCLALLKIGEVLQYPCSAVWNNVWGEGESTESERASAVPTSERLQVLVPIWQGLSSGWVWLVLAVSPQMHSLAR